MMDDSVQGNITLHGLGFIQVKLQGKQRLHVWHPALPRRANADVSPIHNHRFRFESRVLVGTQVNRRYKVRDNEHGGHDRISHDGPRKENGSRLSYVAGSVSIEAMPEEIYKPGMSYIMPVLEYHETPNEGMVATIMQKLYEGDTHASSIIQKGYEFDQEFDRFQLSEDELWEYVREVLAS